MYNTAAKSYDLAAVFCKYIFYPFPNTRWRMLESTSL